MMRGDIRQVLVTGATGFIGQRLVIKLAKQDIKVRALTRTDNASIAQNLYQLCNVSVKSGDLQNPSTLHNVCNECDTVFHLAGYAHAEDSNSEQANLIHRKTTIEGTRALLIEAKRSGVKRFIFVSTVKAIGESNSSCEDESSPAQPLTAYGRAKLDAEKLVLEASEELQMHTAVLRLPLVYGCGNKGNMPRMIAAIDHDRFPPLLNLSNKRSMIHVDDVIQALLLVAENPVANKNVYLVTDDEVYSTSDIYISICKALRKSVPAWSMPIWLLQTGALIGDILGRILGRRFSLNSSSLHKLLDSACYKSDKIKRELGYLPRYTLSTALPEMIAEYQTTQKV